MFICVARMFASDDEYSWFSMTCNMFASCWALCGLLIIFAYSSFKKSPERLGKKYFEIWFHLLNWLMSISFSQIGPD